MAIGKAALSIGVLRFDMKNLDYDRDAKENIHGGSMVDENLIWWNIDFQQMGVGGDNSWGHKHTHNIGYPTKIIATRLHYDQYLVKKF